MQPAPARSSKKFFLIEQTRVGVFKTMFEDIDARDGQIEYFEPTWISQNSFWVLSVLYSIKE